MIKFLVRLPRRVISSVLLVITLSSSGIISVNSNLLDGLSVDEIKSKAMSFVQGSFNDLELEEVKAVISRFSKAF